MAVDYVKTGQPAQLTRDLKPLKWPHFMEKVGKKQHQIYTSKKVLGQLYDQVERIDFVPAFTAPFDTRILQAYTLDENILQSAREVKEEYDAHMRRIMAQQEIKTEFEVWSTFVLQHSSTSSPFKYHEQIGEISMALKDQFRLICHERAGGKDYKHIGPFAAAMYEITAREMTQAVEECRRVQIVGGQPRPLREMTSANMPLMSFPWLFQDVLGKIAKNNSSEAVNGLSIRGEIGTKVAVPPSGINATQPKRGRVDPRRLDSDDYLKTSKGTTHPGQLLELFGKSNETGERRNPVEADYVSFSSISVKSSRSPTDTSVERGSSADKGLMNHASSSSPELLTREHGEDSSKIGKTTIESDPPSKTSSESHIHKPGSSSCSEGGAGVAGLPGKEQPTALNEICFEQAHGESEALSVEPDYNIPEGSDLRHFSDLTMDLSVRSGESGDLLLDSSHNNEGTAIEDANQLSKADVSDEAAKDEKNEIITMETEKNRDAYDKASYSSDSDDESDEVVLSIDVKGRLLDQLAVIVGDDAVPDPRERMN